MHNRESIHKENREIGFELKNGIFKEFCIEATKLPKEKFVFIIDEINRAKLSKVFGELFYSLEPGYRGEKEKYNYITCFKKCFLSKQLFGFRDNKSRKLLGLLLLLLLLLFISLLSQ